MSEKTITELNLNSITISNSNYANIKGFTAQANTLQTNNSGVLLVNGVPISSGGGGAVDAIVEGDGIMVTESPSGTFTITNDGVLGVAAGDGINVTESPPGSGIFEIINTINTDAFLTQSSLDPYSTTTQSNALYQPIGNYLTPSSLDPYSTTTQSNALYQPTGNYLTPTSLDPYSTTAIANTLYQPVGNYLSGSGISNIIFKVLNAQNTNVLPVAVANAQTIGVPYIFADIPYGQNLYFMPTWISGDNSTGPLTLTHLSIEEIESGNPAAGIKGSLDFYNSSVTPGEIQYINILIIQT